MNRIVVVLYSHAKRLERQRLLVAHGLRTLERRGWASVYVTADAQDDEPPMPDVGVMRLDSPPGYEHLAEKTIAMLRWLAERDGWEYVVKCDDDVLLDPWAVRRLADPRGHADYRSVKNIICKANATGSGYHRGKCLDPRLNEQNADVRWAGEGLEFAVGACYVLSRRAVGAALEEFDTGAFRLAEARDALDIRGLGAEDILLASLLRQRGIAPTQSLRLMESRPRFRGLARHMLRESWAIVRGDHGARTCLGAIMDNRSPWPGELTLLRSWFTVSRVLRAARGGA